MSLSYSKSKSKSKSNSKSTIFSFSSNNKKKKRCPNGTRKNKKTGECETKQKIQIENKNENEPNKKKRCPNGTRKNKKTGKCEKRQIENNSKNRSAVKKIQNFMLRTTQKRKLHFLKNVCSDAGVCIAFGQETNKIKNFFDGFTKFRHVTGLKQIGNDSSNGFVLEIQYSRDNYNAHSILKNSLEKDSDNLAYEYFVGQYINKKMNRFPCFLETYGLFINNKNKTTLQTNLQQDLTLISDKSKSNVEDIYKISCTNSDKLSLLIQHISNAKTIGDKLHYPEFIINDLLFVLYQIYMPLMCLQNEFTHYDLHVDNVLLYEPVIGKYIHYHYFVNGTKISFKSKYIAKIIDYGRCFFNDSIIIHNKICRESSCDPECGENYGYRWLHEDGLNGYDLYINSSEVNKSHDLRLMYDITLQKKTIPSFALPQFPLLKELLYKVEYGVGIDDQDDKPFGTMPNPYSGIPDGVINNIQDAYIMLEALVKTSNIQKQNNKDYKYMTKLGDLYVYSEENKPIRFVPKK